jgi:hypothetical protein
LSIFLNFLVGYDSLHLLILCYDLLNLNLKLSVHAIVLVACPKELLMELAYALIALLTGLGKQLVAGEFRLKSVYLSGYLRQLGAITLTQLVYRQQLQSLFKVKGVNW